MVQSVPVPRTDQNKSADGIAGYQHRQARDNPSSGLPAQADDLEQVNQDQIDEL